MAQTNAKNRNAKIIAALTGVGIAGALLAWGGFSAWRWQNAPTPHSQSSTALPNPVAAAPVPADLPDEPADDQDSRASRLAHAASSVHLANESASGGSCREKARRIQHTRGRIDVRTIRP